MGKKNLDGQQLLTVYRYSILLSCQLCLSGWCIRPDHSKWPMGYVDQESIDNKWLEFSLSLERSIHIGTLSFQNSSECHHRSNMDLSRERLNFNQTKDMLCIIKYATGTPFAMHAAIVSQLNACQASCFTRDHQLWKSLSCFHWLQLPRWWQIIFIIISIPFV